MSASSEISAPRAFELLHKEPPYSGAGDLLEVAMGPQHPSTHGVFRMDVVLDGERVVKLKPVFGYLHRNHEKIGVRHRAQIARVLTDLDRKSTRLNSSHSQISYAVFCLKKKN